MQNFYIVREKNSPISMKSDEKSKLKPTELQAAIKAYLTYPLTWESTPQMVSYILLVDKQRCHRFKFRRFFSETIIRIDTAWVAIVGRRWGNESGRSMSSMAAAHPRTTAMNGYLGLMMDFWDEPLKIVSMCIYCRLCQNRILSQSYLFQYWIWRWSIYPVWQKSQSAINQLTSNNKSEEW